MKWIRHYVRGEDPKYIQEKKPGKRKEEHTPGWPHFSTITGACMCLCHNCIGPTGCKCKDCSGVGHWGCRNAEGITKDAEGNKINA